VDRFRRLNQFAFVLRVLKISIKLPFLGLLLYDNGLFSFIALSHGVLTGSRLFSGVVAFEGFAEPERFSLVGSSNALFYFDLFSVISSFELFPLSGFKIARGAGCSSYLVGKLTKQRKVVVKLSSG